MSGSATLDNEDGEKIVVVEETLEQETIQEQPQLSERERLATKYEEQRAQELGLTQETPEEPLSKEEVKFEVPLFTVVLDGVEKKVTEAELIKAYQIDRVTQKRLQEATEIKKRAELELEAAKKVVKEPVVKEDSVEESDFDVEDYILKIREGQDEDAIAATKKFIASVVKSAKRSGAAPEDVDALVDKRLQEREEKVAADRLEEERIAAIAAQEKFDVLFEKDLAQNEDFFDIAIIEDKKLLKLPEWEHRSVEDRYLEAGKRAQKWFLKPTPTTPREERLERKKNLQNVEPKSVRQNLGDPAPETPSTIVKELAASRGQKL